MAKKGNSYGIILFFVIILFIFITSFFFGYSEILRSYLKITGYHFLDLTIYFIVIQVFFLVHLKNNSIYSKIIKFSYIIGNFILSIYSTFYAFVVAENNGNDIEFLQNLFLYVFQEEYLKNSLYKKYFFIWILIWLFVSVVFLFTFGKKCPNCGSKKIKKIKEDFLDSHYQHETKSGNKDLRYKNNKIVNEFVSVYFCSECGHEWDEHNLIISNEDKK